MPISQLLNNYDPRLGCGEFAYFAGVGAFRLSIMPEAARTAAVPKCGHRDLSLSLLSISYIHLNSTPRGSRCRSLEWGELHHSESLRRDFAQNTLNKQISCGGFKL